MATKKPTHSKSGKIAKKAAKPAKKAIKSVKKIVAKKPAKSKPIAKKAAPKKAIKVANKKIGIKKPIAKKAAKSIKPTKKIASQKTVKSKTITKKAIKSVKPAKKIVVKKPIVQAKAAIKPVKQLTIKPNIINTAVVNKKPAALTTVKKPIIIPKTSVRTSVKYTPDFTKSILDLSQQTQSGNMIRYSDVELAEFKELITQKLEPARKELAYLQGLITRKDEMGGDETDNRYMTMEDGSMSMEREQLSQMASRQITFIDHLEKALARIENKTYGICRVTGKLIDKARLRAVPHATLSMEAKMGNAK